MNRKMNSPLDNLRQIIREEVRKELKKIKEEEKEAMRIEEQEETKKFIEGYKTYYIDPRR